MSEKWLPVKGYENLYEVSDFGRVKSLKRFSTNGKILKLVNHPNGYVYVCLCKNNIRKQKRVHKIVLEAFCPEHDPRKNQIDHIDGDKTNNNLSNLEWVTQSENMKRAYKNGLEVPVGIKVIDIDTKEIFNTATEAVRKVGGKRADSIIRVCKGKRSNYRNHRYSYLEDYEKGIIRCFNVKRPKESAKMLWR